MRMHVWSTHTCSARSILPAPCGVLHSNTEYAQHTYVCVEHAYMQCAKTSYLPCVMCYTVTRCMRSMRMHVWCTRTCSARSILPAPWGVFHRNTSMCNMRVCVRCVHTAGRAVLRETVPNMRGQFGVFSGGNHGPSKRPVLGDFGAKSCAECTGEWRVYSIIRPGVGKIHGMNRQTRSVMREMQSLWELRESLEGRHAVSLGAGDSQNRVKTVFHRVRNPGKTLFLGSRVTLGGEIAQTALSNK